MKVRILLAWKIYKNYFPKKRKDISEKKIVYILKFSSLINISSLQFATLLTQKSNFSNKSKLFLKQSYMILMWLTYFNNKSRKYIVLPKIRKRLTITKSPMAHKTFSQEQLQWSKNKIIMKHINTANSYKASEFDYTKILHLISEKNSNKFFNTNLLHINLLKKRYKFVEKTYFKLI